MSLVDQLNQNGVLNQKDYQIKLQEIQEKHKNNSPRAQIAKLRQEKDQLQKEKDQLQKDFNQAVIELSTAMSMPTGGTS